MNTASAYAVIALHPVLHRKSQGSLWLTWVLAAAFVGFAAAGWWGVIRGRTVDVLFVMAAIPLGALLMLWGAMFARGLREQASTSALRLVPHMRARLLAVAGTFVLSCAALSAIVIGVPIGYPGFVFVATCLLLIEMPQIGGWRGYVLFALCIGSGSLPLAAPVLLTDGAVAVGLLLVIVEGRNGMRWLVGTGDNLPRQRAYASWLWMGRADLAPGFSGFKVMRYDPRDKLLDGILGPAVNLRFLGALACIAGLFAVALRYGVLSSDPFAIVQGVLFALPILLFARSHDTVGRIYACKHELALFRMSPAAPGASRINRTLATWLLSRYAAESMVLSIIAVVVLTVAKAEPAMAVHVLAVNSYMIFCAGHMLRDYSLPHRSDLLTNAIWFVTCPLVFVHAVLAALGQLPEIMRAVVPVVWLAAGGLYTWHRRHVMLAAPPAFPPGRRN